MEHSLDGVALAAARQIMNFDLRTAEETGSLLKATGPIERVRPQVTLLLGWNGNGTAGNMPSNVTDNE